MKLESARQCLAALRGCGLQIGGVSIALVALAIPADGQALARAGHGGGGRSGGGAHFSGGARPAAMTHAGAGARFSGASLGGNHFGVGQPGAGGFSIGSQHSASGSNHFSSGSAVADHTGMNPGGGHVGSMDLGNNHLPGQSDSGHFGSNSFNHHASNSFNADHFDRNHADRHRHSHSFVVFLGGFFSSYFGYPYYTPYYYCAPYDYNNGYYPAQDYYDQSYNQEYEPPDNSYYSSNNDDPAAQSQAAQRQGAFQTTAQRSGRDRNDSRELNMAYLAYQSDGAPGEGVGALGSMVGVPAGTLAMRPPLVATLVWTIVGILLIVLLIVVIVKLLRTTATLSSVGKGPLK